MEIRGFERTLAEYGLAFESQEDIELLKETIKDIRELKSIRNKRVERLTFLNEFKLIDVELLAKKINLEVKFVPFLNDVREFITIAFQSNMNRMGFAFSVSEARADIKAALENKEHPRYEFYFSLFREEIREEMKLKNLFEKKRVEMQLVRKLVDKYTKIREESYENESFEEMTQDIAIAFEKMCSLEQNKE